MKRIGPAARNALAWLAQDITPITEARETITPHTLLVLSRRKLIVWGDGFVRLTANGYRAAGL